MSARFTLSMERRLEAADTKRDWNRALFTEVAPRYDLITRVLSFGRDRAWKRRLIGLLPDRPAPQCLDIACGTGDITRLLSRRYARGWVTGMDLTEAMLAIARTKTPAGANVAYVAGDMHALPFPDASFDVLTGGYALRNAPDLDRALAEVGRVVKAGGVAAFLDFSKSSWPPAQRVALALLTFWGGLWGWLLHRNPHVYTYIAASLRRYPDRRELRRRFERGGWRVRISRPLYFGLLEILVLEKSGGA